MLEIAISYKEDMHELFPLSCFNINYFREDQPVIQPDIIELRLTENRRSNVFFYLTVDLINWNKIHFLSFNTLKIMALYSGPVGRNMTAENG